MNCYLIHPKDSEPFLTNWFDTENNYAPGMVVYDFQRFRFTTDGITWNPIAVDHL